MLGFFTFVNQAVRSINRRKPLTVSEISPVKVSQGSAPLAALHISSLQALAHEGNPITEETIRAEAKEWALFLARLEEGVKQSRLAAKAADMKATWEKWLLKLSIPERMKEVVISRYQALEGEESKDIEERVRLALDSLCRMGMPLSESEIRVRLMQHRFTVVECESAPGTPAADRGAEKSCWNAAFCADDPTVPSPGQHHRRTRGLPRRITEARKAVQEGEEVSKSTK